MPELTPEQLAFIDASVRRAEEICEELTNISSSELPSLQIAERTLQLAREMQELGRRVDELTGAKPTADPLGPADFAKMERDIEYLRNRHEPTALEIELEKLAARLLAQQGSLVPEAIYQSRREVDQRIDENQGRD